MESSVSAYIKLLR